MDHYGVEVRLRTNFLVIKETLERMGICNREKKIITPSAYILHKQGRYWILHFKCLLAMDGFRKDIDEKDIMRQNSICSLLQNWGMIEICEDGIYQDPLKEPIFVLSHKDKHEYKISHKYKMSSLRKK